jgi:hypothetical protein
MYSLVDNSTAEYLHQSTVLLYICVEKKEKNVDFIPPLRRGVVVIVSANGT